MYKYNKNRVRRPKNRSLRPVNPVVQSNGHANVIAIAALAVSLIAAAAAALQTVLLKEQLTAGDRNRSFQELVEQAGSICELFHPNKIKEYSYAAQADGTSIIIVAVEDIDPSIFQAELAERIAAASRRLRLAFTVAAVWSDMDQAAKISRAEEILMGMFQYFSSADLSTARFRKFFAIRYVKASHACTNDRGTGVSKSIAALLNETESWWLQAEKPDQVLILPKSEMENLDLAEIRKLAQQQTDSLKDYDGYNQI